VASVENGSQGTRCRLGYLSTQGYPQAHEKQGAIAWITPKVAHRRRRFDALKSEIFTLKSRAESIAKQLAACTRMLRDSELKGQRYITQKVRRVDHGARERREFLEELQRI
jgi:hypothetical protein